jgi:hypothetical protein
MFPLCDIAAFSIGKRRIGIDDTVLYKIPQRQDIAGAI